MKDPRVLRNYGLRSKRRSLFPRMTATNKLILANIVFFILVILLMVVFGDSVFNYIALKPDDVMRGRYLWTFVTSMFMHAPGLIPFLSLHLFINMFVLFSLGNLCERIIGKRRYLWFYLLSGLIAGVMFVLLAYLFGASEIGSRIFGSPSIAAVGASGAIFAIAGLFMVLTPKLRFMIIFLPFFSLPAYLMIPLVLFATWVVSSSVGIGIGNTAHLGGFLSGVVYGLYLKRRYKRKTKLIAKYFAG